MSLRFYIVQFFLIGFFLHYVLFFIDMYIIQNYGRYVHNTKLCYVFMLKTYLLSTFKRRDFLISDNLRIYIFFPIIPLYFTEWNKLCLFQNFLTHSFHNYTMLDLWIWVSIFMLIHRRESVVCLVLNFSERMSEHHLPFT